MDNLHIEIIFSKEGEIYTRQNLAHKRAKVENHVMYEAQKYRKQERNAKNNSSKKAKKLAKRKKNIV